MRSAKTQPKYVAAMESLLRLQGWDNTAGQPGAVKKLVAQIKSYRQILRLEGHIK